MGIWMQGWMKAVCRLCPGHTTKWTITSVQSSKLTSQPSANAKLVTWWQIICYSPVLVMQPSEASTGWRRWLCCKNCKTAGGIWRISNATATFVRGSGISILRNHKRRVQGVIDDNKHVGPMCFSVYAVKKNQIRGVCHTWLGEIDRYFPVWWDNNQTLNHYFHWWDRVALLLRLRSLHPGKTS